MQPKQRKPWKVRQVVEAGTHQHILILTSTYLDNKQSIIDRIYLPYGKEVDTGTIESFLSPHGISVEDCEIFFYKP